MKNIYILVMMVVAGILFWNNNNLIPNLWIKIGGFVLFFFGMMNLSAKTPSKNQENEE